MASTSTTDAIVPVTPGRPTSTFEVQDATEAPPVDQDDNIVYPTGTKLTLTIASVMLACLCYGIDMTIIAVAIPSLTDEFKSIKDIGWYSASYGLAASALKFFWSRCYTLFSIKKTYITSIVILELGALLATVAPSSASFIVGRAVSGCGSAGMSVGTFLILTHSFPNNKRPTWSGIVAMVQTAAMVAAPVIGGGLIAALSWRACFGLNLPLGVIALAFIVFGFDSPITNTDENLALRQKIKKLDLFGTMVFVPAITCLLLALQWGGFTYGWNDARIITLFVLFGILSGVFGFRQYKLGENSILPPRVLKNRNVLAAGWFGACCDSILSVTEIYIAIYFQGVRGFTPFKSGYLSVPMVVGVSAAALIAGFGTTFIGYYTPFMVATSVLAPIASGILTTVDLDTNLPKVLALLGFIGAAVGIGIGAPMSAVPTVLPIQDVPIGMGIIGFMGRLLPAVFISSSATLFQNRLDVEVAQHAPSQNITTVEQAGLSDIRNLIGKDQLRDVLLGYGDSVSQTLYLPVALGVLSVLGTVVMEWRSVKKKND